MSRLACVLMVGVLLVAGGGAGAAEPSDAAGDGAGKLPPDLRSRTDGSDWPQFLGPGYDSKSTETGIRTDWEQDGGLPIVWEKEIGEGYSTVATSRGRLFLFDRHGDRQRLTCMNAETGEELWRFEYPTDYRDYYNYNGGPRASPVVDGNRVYIHGVEGVIHCLRVMDGEVLWKVDTHERYNVVQNFFGTGSTPCVEGELLIVMVGGSPEDSPPIHSGRVEGNGTGVVAFDKRSGEVVYEITDELASYASPMCATIDGQRWCFVFARGGLVGFEPGTGEVGFRYPWRANKLQSVNASNPVVVGDRVFISECYGPGSSLLRVKGDGYEVLWTDEELSGRPRMATHWNTPVHHEGFLYGSSGRHKWTAELRCVELATGEVQWSERGLTRSSLLYVDGHFVGLTERGELVLFRADPEKYNPVASVTLRDGAGQRLLSEPCWAAPVLSHGLMYLRGADRLVCVELIPEKR